MKILLVSNPSTISLSGAGPLASSASDKCGLSLPPCVTSAICFEKVEKILEMSESVRDSFSLYLDLRSLYSSHPRSPCKQLNKKLCTLLVARIWHKVYSESDLALPMKRIERICVVVVGNNWRKSQLFIKIRVITDQDHRCNLTHISNELMCDRGVLHVALLRELWSIVGSFWMFSIRPIRKAKSLTLIECEWIHFRIDSKCYN